MGVVSTGDQANTVVIHITETFGETSGNCVGGLTLRSSDGLGSGVGGSSNTRDPDGCFAVFDLVVLKTTTNELEAGNDAGVSRSTGDTNQWDQ